ncbi:MAG: DUF1858 domain-containing protein [Clostridia bacterium]
MGKVNKEMVIQDVLKMDPDSAKVFFKNGMHCIGCPSASGESIAEACTVHGLDADKLVDELNQHFEE